MGRENVTPNLPPKLTWWWPSCFYSANNFFGSSYERKKWKNILTPLNNMRMGLIQIYPQRKYMECTMGNAKFQVRKCFGDNDLWSVLFKTQSKWVNIVIINSTNPPLKWLSLFYYSSGLNTPSDFRKQVIQSNKHRP
jgi:hypothetical protein